ncbi:GspH/FimT family pseudopilin [Tolumonas lignilytica]|jgi:prepilin-type N-terminal cleavage/methylation domain|uniref:GspH/FimT family pseudopilin n=1 Tax=Tolumonas lignilytica TaxID=1283284 RepID=UPI0004644A9E|nr:GspH/FimT family pseudopilin [Tolumonas lignilytica]
MSKGFTLPELLLSLTIGSLLAVLAPPALYAFVSNSDLQYQSDSIHNALSSARSHAIAINQRVVACLANEKNDCVSAGFTHLLLFIDKNTDNRLTLHNADPDIPLLSSTTFSNRLNIQTNRNEYVFQPDGSVAGSPGTISVCDRHGNNSYHIIVAMSGRIRKTSAAC